MLKRSLVFFALLGSSTAFAGSPRVVGGQQAAVGAWPDAAGICYGPCNANGILCTGVLIAPTVVLTAGHCIDPSQGLTPTAMLLNTNDYRNGGERVAVARYQRNPSYNGYDGHDLSVLVLAQPAQTKPRALAYGCVQDNFLQNGAPVTIVGYGAHDQNGNQYDSILREAFTTITDPDCTDLQSGCSRDISPGGELGAGGNGVDACFGDSGGPLYLTTEYGDYLIGNTSRGYDYVIVPCRDGGIYSRPDSVVNWIEDFAGITIPQTTCNTPPSPSMGGSFDVPSGKTRTKKIDAGDPDQNSGFDWQIVEDPAHGDATIDGDGKVSYTASEKGYLGDDQLVVEVTDTQGYPPESAQIVVPVTIVKGGCGGCNTPGAPTGGWVAGLIALLAVRRRRRA